MKYAHTTVAFGTFSSGTGHSRYRTLRPISQSVTLYDCYSSNYPRASFYAERLESWPGGFGWLLCSLAPWLAEISKYSWSALVLLWIYSVHARMFGRGLSVLVRGPVSYHLHLIPITLPDAS